MGGVRDCGGTDPRGSRKKITVRSRRACPWRDQGGSGGHGGCDLDPDISPRYARIQIDRVAAANHLDRAAVARLVRGNTAGRQAGFLGDPHVNVLRLNIGVANLAAQ